MNLLTLIPSPPLPIHIPPLYIYIQFSTVKKFFLHASLEKTQLTTTTESKTENTAETRRKRSSD